MRILLIEDEQRVLDFIAHGLVAEQFIVDTTQDGTYGLKLATTYQYDLIILDLMLPGLSGTEILQEIRRNNKQMPVLVLTACDAVIEKVKIFDAGADDYLTMFWFSGKRAPGYRAMVKNKNSN